MTEHFVSILATPPTAGQRHFLPLASLQQSDIQAARRTGEIDPLLTFGWLEASRLHYVEQGQRSVGNEREQQKGYLSPVGCVKPDRKGYCS